MDAEPLQGIEQLIDSGRDYLETRIDLFRLKGIKLTSEMVSSIGTVMVITLFGFLVFLMLNIGLGFYLGEVFQKTYLGFFTVAAGYLLIGLLLVALRKKIFKTPIANALIKKLNA